MVGTTHAEIIRSPTPHLTKTQVVGTKNLTFGLIRPKDRFPPVECPLLMFLDPNKSILLIGVL